ncbi:MAG: ATP-binding protein [Chloroflexota bacterium]
MPEFIDRQPEMAALNKLLGTQGGQFVMVYGRRRVGKTTLLRHWVEQSGRPTVYWIARREPAEAVRYSLARAFWQSLGRGQPPRFDSWEPLLEEMANLINERPFILIFDEFPYAVESDPSLPSHLQAAWDTLWQDKPIILILAGSHIGMMVDLLNYQAPLYGRFTAQMFINPLPFAALADFFPRYSAAERVATYAVLGGVPGYLQRFNSQQSLATNIRQHLFRASTFASLNQT